jgi:hypothetical protein
MELPPYLGDWAPDAVWRRHCRRLFDALIEQSVRPLAIVVAAAAAAWQRRDPDAEEADAGLAAGLRTLQAAAVRRRLAAAADEDYWTAGDLRRFGGKSMRTVAWPALRRRLGSPSLARRRRRRTDAAPPEEAALGRDGEVVLVRLWAFQRQFAAAAATTAPPPPTDGGTVTAAWHDARWDVPEDAIRFLAASSATAAGRKKKQR